MIILCALIQVSFPDYLTLWGAKPDLLLLCAIMAGFLFDQKTAVGAGIFIGLIKDAFGSGFPLTNTVLFPLWSALLVWFSRKVSLSDPLVRGVVVAVITFLHYTSSGLLYMYTGSEITPLVLVTVVIAAAFYTFLFSFVICDLIEKLLPRERVETDLEAHPW